MSLELINSSRDLYPYEFFKYLLNKFTSQMNKVEKQEVFVNCRLQLSLANKQYHVLFHVNEEIDYQLALDVLDLYKAV